MLKKTDASNSRGKVFVTDGDKVDIWSEALDTLRKYRVYFIMGKCICTDN